MIADNIFTVALKLALISYVVICSQKLRASEAPNFEDDKRTLIVHINHEKVDLSVSDLLKKVALQKVTVFDIDFQEPRSYWAISWEELVKTFGLGIDQLAKFEQISFVCSDGYTVNSSSTVFTSDTRKAWLALASADGDEPLIDGRWRPFHINNRAIGFDPFYLIWSGENAELDKSLPWPYQLSQIRLLESSEYSLLKPELSNPDLLKGFELYTENCIRCHKVGEVGGAVGPDLIQERQALFNLDDQILATVIANIKLYNPESKMPNYSVLFSESELNQTIKYMRYAFNQISKQNP